MGKYTYDRMKKSWYYLTFILALVLTTGTVLRPKRYVVKNDFTNGLKTALTSTLRLEIALQTAGLEANKTKPMVEKKQIIKLAQSSIKKPIIKEEKKAPKNIEATYKDIEWKEINLNQLELEDDPKISFVEVDGEEEVVLENLDSQIISDENLIINNDELLTLNGFEVSAPQVISWVDYMASQRIEEKIAAINDESMEIPSIIEKPITQEVTQVASAPAYNPKSKDMIENFVNDEEDLEAMALTAKKKNEKKNESEDLVFFEYSEPNKKVVKKAEEVVTPVLVPQPTVAATPTQTINKNSITSVSKSFLSPEVQEVIKREMEESIKKAPKVSMSKPSSYTPTQGKKTTDKVSQKQSSYDYSKSVTTQTKISAFEVAIGEYSKDKVFNYEFIPEFDKGLSTQDDEDGEIRFASELSDGHAMLRGSVTKAGMVRTKIDIPLDMAERDFVIPMITLESMEKFLEKNDLEGYGAFMLIGIQENVDDVEIDQEYEFRVFLNDDFKVVDQSKDYQYVFYVGVNPGNVLVQYLTQNGSVAQKITHASPDEIYYDLGMISSPVTEMINIQEMNTLSKVTKDLDISVDKINYFNQKVSMSKEGLGKYEMVLPPTPYGMRRYIELNHLEDTVFVGFGDKTQLNIPSIEFIQNIMGLYNINELTKECIIQLNFSSQPLEVTIDGDSANGALAYESHFLGKDGILYEEINNGITNGFLVGQDQGVFNIKVEYTNGTTNYFQTFCSEGTYLVEQL